MMLPSSAIDAVQRGGKYLPGRKVFFEVTRWYCWIDPSAVNPSISLEEWDNVKNNMQPHITCYL